MAEMFSLGVVVATRGALKLLENVEAGPFPAMTRLLRRHASGDWGEICDEDKAENDSAVTQRGRILSAYTVNGEKLWIITEANREATALLLPSEY